MDEPMLPKQEQRKYERQREDKMGIQGGSPGGHSGEKTSNPVSCAEVKNAHKEGAFPEYGCKVSYEPTQNTNYK